MTALASIVLRCPVLRRENFMISHGVLPACEHFCSITVLFVAVAAVDFTWG